MCSVSNVPHVEPTSLMTLASHQRLSIHRESKSSVDAKVNNERPAATHSICLLEVEYPAQEIRLQVPNSHLNCSQIKFADLGEMT